MTPVEVRVSRVVPSFPYIPGLLAFREVPLVLPAVIVDGQGLAHPRRFGIACHIGLLLGVPTTGCAKSILRGRHSPLGEQAGSWADLADDGEVVGAAVRTKEGTSPVYVSIGHRIDLEAAVKLVLDCCRGYRLPEPIRLAHLAAAGSLPQRAPTATTVQQRLL
jgi:deoxyribonuclease V